MTGTILLTLEYFLENPYEEVHLRDLARKTKRSTYTTKKNVDILVKENLITEERRAHLRLLRANTSNQVYKHLKKARSIQNLLRANIISYVENRVTALAAIILFGSVAKGEDSRESDIDLLIIGKEKKTSNSADSSEITKLDRELNIHIMSWSAWTETAEKNTAFYNEVVRHGIPLYGEVPYV